jgi:hypothetical protein
MAYSDFKSVEQVVSVLHLSVQDRPHLFADVAPIAPSAWLQAMLERTLALATSISTEKARSELILTPIFLELRELCQQHIGYFSGTTFNVDDSQGLTGACDFLLSASTNQSMITAPVLTIVEAKDNDIRIGLGQCMAQMRAAQIFNSRQGVEPLVIYGAVSTGTIWKFLRLQGDGVEIDLTEYLINQVDRILGILALPFRDYCEL